MVSDPDLAHVEAACKRLDFLVVQDIFLTETAQLADVVLPAACFAEKDGTFTNTERRVQRAQGGRAAGRGPRRLGDRRATSPARLGHPMAYAGAEAIMDEIARRHPVLRRHHLRAAGARGAPLALPGTDHPGTPFLHMDKFTRGLGVFSAVDYRPPAEPPDDEYPLTLTTGRVLYQYHTGTMTMKTDGLNERAPECFVEIAARGRARARRRGRRPGAASARAAARSSPGRASPAMTAPGTVFMPFHFAEAAANRLTSAARARPGLEDPGVQGLRGPHRARWRRSRRP